MSLSLLLLAGCAEHAADLEEQPAPTQEQLEDTTGEDEDARRTAELLDALSRQRKIDARLDIVLRRGHEPEALGDMMRRVQTELSDITGRAVTDGAGQPLLADGEPAERRREPSIAGGKPAIDRTWSISARLRTPQGGFESEDAMRAEVDAAQAAVRGLGAAAVHAVYGMPFIGFSGEQAVLEAAVRTGRFDGVTENVEMYADLAESVPLISADITATLGFDGDTQAIAVIDTGVDVHHAAFTGRVVEQACYSNGPAGSLSTCPNGSGTQIGAGAADACVGNAAGIDGCEHGTHVAGIAAGSNIAECDGCDGVAPGASLIAVNVFHRRDDAASCGCGGAPCITGTLNDVASGLSFVSDQVLDHNIAAVNLSLGSGKYTSEATCDTIPNDPRRMAIDVLQAQGIIVVAAAGNQRRIPPACNVEAFSPGIGAPACMTGVIAVGNTTKADVVHSSGYSHALIDFWAPGVAIVSSVPSGDPQMSGTSMSAPHVAGAVAVMRHYDPTLELADIIGHFNATGVPITDARVGITRDRIDVAAAITRVSNQALTPAASERFGAKVVSGDFNNDGFQDLAVGVPGHIVGGFANAGAVDVFFGTRKSLSIAQQWTQNSSSVADTAEANDGFGEALAAGDFNNDGFDDLAIGVPGEDVGALTDAGAVHVLYGSATGLQASNDQFWHQDSTDIEGSAEMSDAFGSALAVGLFNSDARADLAIGAPGEAVGALASAGSINVIYGSANGLAAAGDQLWHQDAGGMNDASEANDQFGNALAAGDITGDGRHDLVIGIRGESFPNITSAGAIAVMRGSANGLTDASDQFWHQDVANVPDSNEAGDQLGLSVAVGRFDSDAFADVAVGIPYENIGVSDQGMVQVFRGTANGITATNAQTWSQDSAGIVDTGESGDLFGWALGVGSFDGNATADLAIGVYREDTVQTNSGAVHVLYSTAAGLGSASSQFWTQSSVGVADSEELEERLGGALCSGDFDGDSIADLAMGAPSDPSGALTAAGLVSILDGAATRLVGSDQFVSE